MVPRSMLLAMLRAAMLRAAMLGAAMLCAAMRRNAAPRGARAERMQRDAQDRDKSFNPHGTTPSQRVRSGITHARSSRRRAGEKDANRSSPI